MVSEHQFYILTIVVIVVIFLIIIMGCCFITKQREHFTSAPKGRPWMDKTPKSALYPRRGPPLQGSGVSFKCYRSLNRPGGPAAGTSLSGVESIKTGRDPIYIEQSFNWFNTQ